MTRETTTISALALAAVLTAAAQTQTAFAQIVIAQGPPPGQAADPRDPNEQKKREEQKRKGGEQGPPPGRQGQPGREGPPPGGPGARQGGAQPPVEQPRRAQEAPRREPDAPRRAQDADPGRGGPPQDPRDPRGRRSADPGLPPGGPQPGGRAPLPGREPPPPVKRVDPGQPPPNGNTGIVPPARQGEQVPPPPPPGRRNEPPAGVARQAPPPPPPPNVGPDQGRPADPAFARQAPPPPPPPGAPAGRPADPRVGGPGPQPPQQGQPQQANRNYEPPAAFRPSREQGPPPSSLKQIQSERQERREDGRTIIQEPGRTIIRENNTVIIRHDESERLRRFAPDLRQERRPDGVTVNIFNRPGGIQVVTETDQFGRPLRRFRRDAGGREVVLFENRPRRPGIGTAVGIGVGLGVAAAIVALAPPVIRIPRERYIVEYDRASEGDIYEALAAPPVEELERRYTLEEVRYSQSLRERMRRVDLDTINFEFGAWAVGGEQFPKLERIARAMQRVIERDPSEVFLIEGHTDAVGSDVDNLSLSDRRAEAVAAILTEQFGVPPENLVTQGYGEQFLKVPTQAPEAQNRRVAVRRISPLLARE